MIKLLLTFLSVAFLQAEPLPPLFDMEEMRDATTLEIEVLKDWHPVDGRTPTRQKLITINVGEMWPGQDFRIPVRFTVPADGKAHGFHLTGGNVPKGLQEDFKPGPFEVELLKRGIGFVDTVVQEPASYGEEEMAHAAEQHFATFLNFRSNIKYWAWPAALMRSITAAHAEKEYFEPGKIAVTGYSKNGASPSMAIIHDNRMTAVHASVSPIWDSPLRLRDPDALKAHLEAKGSDSGFSGGHFGPNFARDALKAGHTPDDLRTLVNEVSDQVFISRNLKSLRARKVEMLFHPGTHDMVAYDLAWGGEHFPTIPVYLGANTGHGKKGHPNLERDEQNKQAFLLRHFFPDQISPLLTPPKISHQLTGDTLQITVEFPSGSGEETGRIWWITNRPPDGSPGYLTTMIPDENSAEMTHDPVQGKWTATLKLDPKASHLDVFTNHRKTLTFAGKAFATYLSSPYTRIIPKR